MFVWVIKFIFLSVYQLITLPFGLFTNKPWAHKRQDLLSALISVPIIIGTYLSFSGSIIFGVLLILGAMTLGAVLVKDDGTL